MSLVLISKLILRKKGGDVINQSWGKSGWFGGTDRPQTLHGVIVRARRSDHISDPVHAEKVFPIIRSPLWWLISSLIKGHFVLFSSKPSCCLEDSQGEYTLIVPCEFYFVLTQSQQRWTHLEIDGVMFWLVVSEVRSAQNNSTTTNNLQKDWNTWNNRLISKGQTPLTDTQLDPSDVFCYCLFLY